MSMRRPEPPAHLNLVPVMNLVTILIPFLLLSAQFVAIAVIETTAPAICADCDPEPDTPRLEFELTVDDRGFHIDGEGTETVAERTLLCAGACTIETYDWSALARRARQLHDAWPEATSVTLLPGERVPYEVVLRTMDAVRQDDDGQPWFPHASIGIPRG